MKRQPKPKPAPKTPLQRMLARHATYLRRLRTEEATARERYERAKKAADAYQTSVDALERAVEYEKHPPPEVRAAIPDEEFTAAASRGIHRSGR